jgi:hypothetical protein
MKTVNLEQYADPDVLREFSPRMLVALLDEDRPFLAGKGVTLPTVAEIQAANGEAVLDYEAQAAVTRCRRSAYFVPRMKKTKFAPPAKLTGLEKTLNGWYEAHHRDRSARVGCRRHGDEFLFYVRHGEPVKREGAVGLLPKFCFGPFPVGKGVNQVRANASGQHLKPSNVRSHSADEAGAVNQRSGRKRPCARR